MKRYADGRARRTSSSSGVMLLLDCRGTQILVIDLLVGVVADVACAAAAVGGAAWEWVCHG